MCLLNFCRNSYGSTTQMYYYKNRTALTYINKQKSVVLYSGKTRTNEERKKHSFQTPVTEAMRNSEEHEKKKTVRV